MAEIALVSAHVPEDHKAGRFTHGVFTHKWETLTESDTCEALADGGSAEKSVQFAGTFGSGSCTLTGSNDGTNYVTLYDTENVLINPSAAGIFTIRDNVRYIKPGTPTGSSVDLDITILAKVVR